MSFVLNDLFWVVILIKARQRTPNGQIHSLFLVCFFLLDFERVGFGQVLDLVDGLVRGVLGSKSGSFHKVLRYLFLLRFGYIEDGFDDSVLAQESERWFLSRQLVVGLEFVIAC